MEDGYLGVITSGHHRECVSLKQITQSNCFIKEAGNASAGKAVDVAVLPRDFLLAIFATVNEGSQASSAVQK